MAGSKPNKGVFNRVLDGIDGTGVHSPSLAPRAKFPDGFERHAQPLMSVGKPGQPGTAQPKFNTCGCCLPFDTAQTGENRHTRREIGKHTPENKSPQQALPKSWANSGSSPRLQRKYQDNAGPKPGK